MEDVFNCITQKFDEMSKSQKKIAEYILQNKDNVAFMNVNELSKATQVSEASIIRFSTFLGYKGFSDFQNYLKEKTRKQLSLNERLENSYSEYNEDDAGIAKVFNDDINNIKKTIAKLDFDEFRLVAKKILDARTVFIVAGRSAMSISYFMKYYLNIVRDNVEIISSINENEEKICNAGKEDLVIGITFERYTASSIQLFEYLKKAGVQTVAITDYLTSPILKFSDNYFLMETNMNTYLDSFVAPLSFINAMLTYIGRAGKEKIEKRLEKLDLIWKQFEIFKE